MIFRYADTIDREEEEAMVEKILKKQNMTKYRLAVEAGIPHATLNDICSGKPDWKNAVQKRYIN